jgi:hypothetical protein
MEPWTPKVERAALHKEIDRFLGYLSMYAYIYTFVTGK